MKQSQFFDVVQPVRLGELAAHIGAELSSKDFAEYEIESIAPIYRAGPLDICYIQSKKSLPQLDGCRAGAIICPPGLVSFLPKSLPLLVTDKPQLAFARISALLYPQAMRPQSVTGPAAGISPHAVVDPSALIEKSVEIGPFVVIGPRVAIGAGTRILPGCVVGADVKIGRNVTLAAQVSVSHSLIGNNVIIHPGVRIGQDGFGYAPGPSGMIKLPQVGRVIIQDDVEIGANSTIDRGAMDDTIIGEGTKIDNLVQIGHNVEIGRHCAFVSQSGVAGSTKIGDGVMIGGQVGVNGHIEIGSGVQIAAKSGVYGSVPDGMRIGGDPARPIRDHLRHVAETLKRASNAGENQGE